MLEAELKKKEKMIAELIAILEKIIAFKPEYDLYCNHWPMLLSDAKRLIEKVKKESVK